MLYKSDMGLQSASRQAGWCDTREQPEMNAHFFLITHSKPLECSLLDLPIAALEHQCQLGWSLKLGWTSPSCEFSLMFVAMFGWGSLAETASLEWFDCSIRCHCPSWWRKELCKYRHWIVFTFVHSHFEFKVKVSDLFNWFLVCLKLYSEFCLFE